MSNYNIGGTDDWGFDLIKREGQVEMWHNPKSGSYLVYLYEHVQQDEGFVLHATKYTRESADWVFDTIISMLG